jgi:fructose-bisphosphate aldolase, class II
MKPPILERRESMPVRNSAFEKALEIGRPPNIVKLFPHSRALLVSGKVIDRAMLGKGKAMTIAANGRNAFIIRGLSWRPRKPMPPSSSR